MRIVGPAIGMEIKIEKNYAETKRMYAQLIKDVQSAFEEGSPLFKDVKEVHSEGPSIYLCFPAI